jgi:hypothetical protein
MEPFSVPDYRIRSSSLNHELLLTTNDLGSRGGAGASCIFTDLTRGGELGAYCGDGVGGWVYNLVNLSECTLFHS